MGVLSIMPVGYWLCICVPVPKIKQALEHMTHETAAAEQKHFTKTTTRGN